MPIMTHSPSIYLPADKQGDDGFFVGEVRTEGGRFSFTGALYASREMWKLGNDNGAHAFGMLHDEWQKYLPEHAWVLPMHLCDIETGEDMHALSNSRYRLDPSGDFATEMRYRAKGQKNYYITGKDDRGYYRDGKWVERSATEDEIMEYIVGLAAKTLRVDVSALPDRLDGGVFEDFVDGLRPKWEHEAKLVREWIESLPKPTIGPADEPSEEWSHTFENGLEVSAEVIDDIESPIMPGEYVTQYEVKVKWGDETHTTKSTGSVNDYWLGHHDAKLAAFSVLREIHDYGSDGADELYDAMEWDEDDPRRAECDALGERFIDGIEPNLHIIGY